LSPSSPTATEAVEMMKACISAAPGSDEYGQ
jgi:hypothetical protein